MMSVRASGSRNPFGTMEYKATVSLFRDCFRIGTFDYPFIDDNLKSLTGDADVSENPIVFADGNIEWFNPTTREIRFRDLEPAKAFVPYREIVFRLDDETLFAAATIVSDVNSQIYYDLVLYLSDPVEPRCYLNDAYPLWPADSDEARANAEARAEGWNKFIEQLRQDGRLQE